MTETIHVDQFLPQPPEKVWRMLTEPERLSRWWAPNDIEAVVGHRFTLDMASWGLATCTVTTVDPMRELAYTFAEERTDWTLTWRLVPEGSGTRLFLAHSGFDLSDPAQQRAFTNMSRGWATSVWSRLERELVSTS